MKKDTKNVLITVASVGLVLGFGSYMHRGEGTPALLKDTALWPAGAEHRGALEQVGVNQATTTPTTTAVKQSRTSKAS